jgi:hypothetical protein
MLTGVPEPEVLNKIFANQTSPRPILPAWPRVKLSDICRPRDSPEVKNMLRHLVHREHALVKICQLKEVLGQEGLDLLERMLELDP